MSALLECSLEEFLEYVKEPRKLRHQLRDAFRTQVGEGGEFGGEEADQANLSEERSWERSLPRLAQALAGLRGRDIGVLIEYTLPGTNKRVDVMLCGQDENGRQSLVVIELKQWSSVSREGAQNPTLVFDGLEWKLHPGNQVHGYLNWLREHHSYVVEHTLGLTGAVYLHNLAATYRDQLQGEKELDYLQLFYKEQDQALATFVQKQVGAGGGTALASEICNGYVVQTPALLDVVIDAVAKGRRFQLLDEQENVYQTVLKALQNTQQQRTLILVKGVPGSGKSAIAIHLLAWAAREAKRRKGPLRDIAVYTTRSKAIRTNLDAALKNDDVQTPTSGIIQDVKAAVKRRPELMICDEAQRFSEEDLELLFNTNGKPKLKQTIVVFQDDRQIVRPDERGSAERIERIARNSNSWDIYPNLDLSSQFRCTSKSYIEWIDHLLYHDLDGDLLPSSLGGYDFRILDRSEDLEKYCHQPADRILSGYTFRWHTDSPAGEPLPLDVALPGRRWPWNASPFNHPSDRPETNPYTLWATRPYGITQAFPNAPREIGCIYSAQGFGFNRCAVIIGPDLIIRDGRWVAQADKSQDSVIKKARLTHPREEMLRLLLNTYRVLLTRAASGCAIYVHNTNERQRQETVEYIRDKLAQVTRR